MSVTIREQSEQLKAAAAERLPTDVVEVFDRSIQNLLDQGVPAEVVAVGDTLDSFTLRDVTGAQVTLDQLVETGPASSSFTGRVVPLLQPCVADLPARTAPEARRFRRPAVAVSPQSPDQSLSTVEKAELGFTVLSDPGSRVAQQIGIVFQQADEVSTLNASLASTWPRSTPRAPPDCRGPPCSLWSTTGWCVSWTSSRITRPAPRSPTSSPRWRPSVPRGVNGSNLEHLSNLECRYRYCRSEAAHLWDPA